MVVLISKVPKPIGEVMRSVSPRGRSSIPAHLNGGTTGMEALLQPAPSEFAWLQPSNQPVGIWWRNTRGTA